MLIVNSKEALLTSVGKQFSPIFTGVQLVGSDNSEVVDPDDYGGKNYKGRVTMNRSGYSGSGTSYYQKIDSERSDFFYYNKIDLSVLATAAGDMFKVRSTGTKPTSMHGLIADFRKTFGIGLSTNDVDDTAISWTGDVGTVTVQAKTNGLVFTGSVTLTTEFYTPTFTQGPVALGNITSSVAIPVQGDEQISVSYRNRIVVFDGVSTRLFDTNLNTWSLGAGRTATLHCACVWGNHAYIYNNNNQLYRYDIINNSYATLATNTLATTNRDYAVIGAINGKLYVHGGSSSTVYGETYCYDILTNTWSSVATGPVKARHAGCVINNELYVMGGIINNGNTVTNVLSKYNPTTNTWTTLAAGPRALQIFAGCNMGGRFYISGGRDGGATYYDNVSVYDPITDDWDEAATLPVAIRGRGIASVGNAIYTLGGNNSVGTYTSAVNKIL